MARAKILLRDDERDELIRLFTTYPQQRIMELLLEEESIIPEKLHDYLPYIEGQIHVALIRSIDEYNKSAEKSKSTRPRNFKRYADAASENQVKRTVQKMSAAIARVEGNASRNPLKADKELYEELQLVAQGYALLQSRLDEINS